MYVTENMEKDMDKYLKKNNINKNIIHSLISEIQELIYKKLYILKYVNIDILFGIDDSDVGMLQPKNTCTVIYGTSYPVSIEVEIYIMSILLREKSFNLFLDTIVNTTIHELRHIYQYENNFKMSYVEKYDDRPQEIDAINYTNKFIKNNKKEINDIINNNIKQTNNCK